MTRAQACAAMCARADMPELFTESGPSLTAAAFALRPERLGGCQAVIFRMAMGLWLTGELPEPDASVSVPAHKQELLAELVAAARSDVRAIEAPAAPAAPET